MADLDVALARKRLKTIATGLSGTGETGPDTLTLAGADIVIGLSVFPDEHLGSETKALQSVDMIIGPASFNYAASTNPLAIPAELRAVLDSSRVELLTNLDNLVEAIGSAWRNAINYPPGELICGALQWLPAEIDQRPDRIIVKVPLVAFFPTPL